LGDYLVNENKHEKFKGVIHIDGTVRSQIVSNGDKQNRLIYDLLEYLYQEYKIEGLINTSFNIRGKPIVHTQNDAIEQAEKMGLDGVIFDDRVHLF